MESIVPVRRVQRVRHELRRRELEVARVERLGPGFVAVTFRGPELADFVSASFDDHVKLILEDGGDEPVRRDYTPRQFDRAANELIIEFAVHAAGRASDWARQARPGQKAIVGGPRGSLIIPADYEWHLLAGDATALPAIRRRIEELPAHARILVVAKADEGERLPFAGAARPEVQWVASEEELVAAVQSLPLPAGEGFSWAAGEAATMARVRKVLLDEKRQPRETMRVAAYWKRGASAHHENLED
jgi:NADPH-dependent ferric siderophore reductase